MVTANHPPQRFYSHRAAYRTRASQGEAPIHPGALAPGKTPAGPGAPAQALTKVTSLLPSAGKQSAGFIPTRALKSFCCFCTAQ